MRYRVPLTANDTELAAGIPLLGPLSGSARIAGGRCLFVPPAFVLECADGCRGSSAIAKPTSEATAKEIR
jgi:hypothetical protein